MFLFSKLVKNKIMYIIIVSFILNGILKIFSHCFFLEKENLTNEMQIISLQDHLAQIEIEAKETFFYKNTGINFFRSDFIVIFKMFSKNMLF